MSDDFDHLGRRRGCPSPPPFETSDARDGTLVEDNWRWCPNRERWVRRKTDATPAQVNDYLRSAKLSEKDPAQPLRRVEGERGPRVPSTPPEQVPGTYAIGHRFGWMLIVGNPTRKDGRNWWPCRCDYCEQVKLMRQDKLKDAIACGCREIENRKEHYSRWLNRQTTDESNINRLWLAEHKLYTRADEQEMRRDIRNESRKQWTGKRRR